MHAYIHTYIHVCCYFLCSGTGKRFSNQRERVVFLSWIRDSNPEGLWDRIYSRLNARWQTDWTIEDQAKNLKSTAVPMISEHSAHLTQLPFGIHTWLWRYTCLLLLISMIWHRQAIFERKQTSCLPLLNAGFDPRGSLEPNLQQTECPLTNRLNYQGSTWSSEKLEVDSPSLWPASIQPTQPHCI